jgi:glutamyl-Q tRNA(Asp) synthetase
VIRPDLAAARLTLAAPIITRFAPSPTGYLHLGHVVNAIYVWGMAQALGGQVILRIEDHDRIRCRPAFEAAILEDLHWLGFVDDLPAASVVRQRHRDEVYAHALARLRRVAHLYACDCSRATFSGERYPGRCRDRGLAEGPGRGLRVHFEPGTERGSDLLLGDILQTPADQCGDLLIKDREGQWTYQFAVTVDDFHHRVTLVARGVDLLASTGRQLRLGELLRRAGLTEGAWPPRYLHHPLIFDSDGAKLSKSTGATGVRHLRETGMTPGEVIGMAAAAVGLLPAPVAVEAGRAGALLAPSTTRD